MQPLGMNTQMRDPGSFQLAGLPPGDYTLVVRGNPIRAVAPAAGSTVSTAPVLAAQSPIASQFSGRVDVTLGNADLENVTIRLTAGVEIVGKITVEGGAELATLMAPLAGAGNRQAAPLAGAALAQPPQGRMPSVMLTAIEGPAAQLSATANPDGTFRVSNIPPLKRVLLVSSLPPSSYIKSVRFGGQDVTRAALDLSTGSGGVLEILIGTKGGEIAATPRDEKGETPQGGAPVTIWPRTPNPGSPNGDVRLIAPGLAQVGTKAQGLAPGEYYVAAWEVASMDYIRVPEFLARFTSLATKVSVAEGGSITVEPKIDQKRLTCTRAPTRASSRSARSSSVGVMSRLSRK